jgi:hypothetical protein
MRCEVKDTANLLPTGLLLFLLCENFPANSADVGFQAETATVCSSKRFCLPVLTRTAWISTLSECSMSSLFKDFVRQSIHHVFRVFETPPMLPTAPADSITNRCKPISNRLTASRDSTGNSRQLSVKSYPLNWLSSLLSTSCMNTPLSSRNGTARAFHQCGS